GEHRPVHLAMGGRAGDPAVAERARMDHMGGRNPGHRRGRLRDGRGRGASARVVVGRWTGASGVLFFVVVVGGQFLLSNLIKVAVERVRPDVPPLHVVNGPSFPSGHATAAAATWAAVALVLGRGASPRVRAALDGVAVAIAVAVGCSRVLLGAHWTSDVLGGLILGWIWFGVCAVAFGGRVLRLGAPADAV